MDDFTEQGGPRVPLPHDPLGLFSLFFDDSLISLVVEETNRYAEQALSGKDKEWSTNVDGIHGIYGTHGNK